MGPAKKELADAATNFNNSNVGVLPPRFARIAHIDVLQQIHEEYIKAATRIQSERLELRPEHVFQQTGAYGKALVATVPAAELQRLYHVHGDALFDRNIRVFLGARTGSVNAGIRETLASSSERRNFWAYNNGLTFICDRYEFEPTTGRLTVHNFSIVNGCQTTVSIVSGPDPAPDSVALLARFIAASDGEVVDSIIRYTNSQTPIRQLGY